MAASLTGARYLRDAIMADSAQITGSAEFGGSVTVMGGLSGDGSKLTGIANPVTATSFTNANGIAARLTNKWANSHVLSYATLLSAVAWSPTLNIFAAVGNGGQVNPPGDSFFSSPDGLTWTPRMVGSYSEWYDVAWGDNKFVAVGDNASTYPMTATSVDGINWTLVTNTTGLGSTIGLSAVIWSPEQSKFVAVSSGTWAKGSAVSTDGVNWTYNNAAPAVTYGWSSLVWAASLGKYVAIATTSQVMTSPDGVTWTLTTTLSGGFLFNTLVWSPKLSLLVAIGQQAVFLSSDGLAWSKYGTSPQTDSAIAAYGAMWVPDNGGYFVTLGTFQVGLNHTSGAVSTDGHLWMPFYDPTVLTAVNAQSTGSLGYSPSLQRLVFVSSAMGAADVNGGVAGPYASNTSGFLGVGTNDPQQTLDVGGYVRTQQPTFLAIGTETAAVNGSNMSFANVLVNVGNCYNFGYFMCGASGVHSFTASASIAPGSALWLNKIGTPNMTLGKASNTGNGYVYISVSATSPLQLMDQVSVQCYGGAGLCDTGSTFSGAMLYAT